MFLLLGSHRRAVGSRCPSFHGAVCHLLPGQTGSPVGHQHPSAPVEQEHRGGCSSSTDTCLVLLTDIMLIPSLVLCRLLVLQDPGRSAGFHPSGAVLAVGTMTGRLVQYFFCNLCFSSTRSSIAPINDTDLLEPAYKHMHLCPL